MRAERAKSLLGQPERRAKERALMQLPGVPSDSEKPRTAAPASRWPYRRLEHSRPDCETPAEGGWAPGETPRDGLQDAGARFACDTVGCRLQRALSLVLKPKLLGGVCLTGWPAYANEGLTLLEAFG